MSEIVILYEKQDPAVGCLQNTVYFQTQVS